MIMFEHAYQWMLITLLASLPLGTTSLAYQSTSSQDPANIIGRWRAQLGDTTVSIGFDLEVAAMAAQPEKFQGVIINGEERIDVPLSADDQGWVLEMPHYESAIRFQQTSPGELRGTWKKRRTKERFGEMPFLATKVPLDPIGDSSKVIASPNQQESAAQPNASHDRSLARRWAIQFASSPDLAIGIFEPARGSQSSAIRGTVLTTTGDYRYLAGYFSNNHLELSCFDGAHAFLIKGVLDESTGKLSGNFYSGNWHQEAWTGWVDAKIELPDPFQITAAREVQWDKISLADVEGKIVSLSDARWMGRPRIVEIFGSWCPNCHDAAPLLSELQREFQIQGLEIIGLVRQR